MQTIDEHKKEIQIVHEDSHNYKFTLIKYPCNPRDKAIYQCIACHFFEMNPKDFLKVKQCPICKIDETISRNNIEYRSYLQKAKKYNQGKCELTGDNNIAVHHLYSIRKYPELVYHPDNAILLNKKLHKEYHRKYSPTNTNGYTFLAWLNDEAKELAISNDPVNRLSKKVHQLMGILEKEIANNRCVNRKEFTPQIIHPTVTKKKNLQKMEWKANKLTGNIDHLETIEIIENNVFLLKMYYKAFIIYRNDFGNLNEYNPISGSIQKNVYKAVMNA